MFTGKKEVKWFPNYLIALSIAFLIVLVVIIGLAVLFPVPDDAPQMIPLPDNGQYIPGPEWVFTLFWMPFWYFKGRAKKYLVYMTVIPIIIFLILVFLPYLDRLKLDKFIDRIPKLRNFIEKAKGLPSGKRKSLLYGLPAIVFTVLMMGSMVFSGYNAKLLGCDSCHNPAMGYRMAIPPIDILHYYTVDRARQIDIGKYRAGKSDSASDKENWSDSGADSEGGYKDANWQMRHMYEPTFTW